jgi:NAD(P)-dependent dehydrogenase (short-subunit alcohol dehydrogenase family)
LAEEKDHPLQGRLNGRVGLITGASRGIGEAIARAFAREGCAVSLAATSTGSLEEIAASLNSGGGRAQVIGLDVTDRNACFVAVEKAVDHFGQLDILVNAAGVHIASRFTAHTVADFDRMMQVNFYGPMHLMQAALAVMEPRKRGKIINIASTAGKWASPNQAAYNSSKHALVGLTRCVALEAAASGIMVNAICPGFVDTKMRTDLLTTAAALNNVSVEQFTSAAMGRVAMRRRVTTAEVAALAIYLASPESDAMTGQSILLDGGMLFV